MGLVRHMPAIGAARQKREEIPLLALVPRGGCDTEFAGSKQPAAE